MSESWVIVPRWDEFQHYAKRDPIWVKVYTRLLSDDRYLELTFHQRGILQGIWLEYARSAGQLPGTTLTLTRRLSGKVSTRDLEALNHAGFIEIVASRPSQHVAIPEAEPETEKEEEPEQNQDRPVAALVDISLRETTLVQPLLDLLPPAEIKRNTKTVLERKFLQLPPHFVQIAGEELLAAGESARSPVRYLNGIADRMLDQQARRGAA